MTDAQLKTAAGDLASLVRQSSYAIAFTGAGLSTESGIPDFRSPGGLWTQNKPIPFQAFMSSRAARTEAWRRKFVMDESFRNAAPSRGHRVLAAMVRAGRLAGIITQNIDNLHQDSGIVADRMVELHGNGTFATCLSCARRYELGWVRERYDRLGGEAPDCEACGGPVKSATVSFGQAMPEAEMARASDWTLRCDLFIAIGSSLVVYPAAGLPDCRAAQRRAPRHRQSRADAARRDRRPRHRRRDRPVAGRRRAGTRSRCRLLIAVNGASTNRPRNGGRHQNGSLRGQSGCYPSKRESRRGGIEANDPDRAAVSVMTSDGSDPDGLGGKGGLLLRADVQGTAEEVPGDLVEVAGTIKWFDVAKGYGFIVPDGGGPDVLLHVTSLRRDGFQTAYEGARIVVEATARARGLQTFRVLSMDDSTAIHPALLPPARTHVSVVPTSGLERAEVKWFNRLRGFGFLSRGPGTPDIFVHMETLRRYGMTELRPGQWVLVRFGDGSKGLMAAEVHPDGAPFPASH